MSPYLNILYILSFAVSELFNIIGQILAFDRRQTFVQGEHLNSKP